MLVLINTAYHIVCVAQFGVPHTSVKGVVTGASWPPIKVNWPVPENSWSATHVQKMQMLAYTKWWQPLSSGQGDT